MWDGCPALEYRLLSIAVFVFGFWLASVSERTHECGCLVKLLWFFSMLGGDTLYGVVRYSVDPLGVGILAILG